MSPQISIVRERIIALVAILQLYDIFSPFHGVFHNLFAQVVIFKSFFHLHSLHSILLPLMVAFLILRKSRFNMEKGKWKVISNKCSPGIFPDHMFQIQKTRLSKFIRGIHQHQRMVKAI